MRGNYTLSGEKLIMTGVDEDGDNIRTVFNCTIKGNNMTITTTEGIILSLIFNRVKDSVIEKYL